MKTMYKIILINTFAALVFGFIYLWIYQNQALIDTEDYIFNQKITLENKVVIESIPTSSSYQIIYASYKAMNRSDQIGNVYEIHIKNGYVFDPEKGYGYMKAYVGIDNADRIFVEIFEIDQTSIYRKNILDFVESSLQNLTLEQLEKVIPLDAAYDLSTGATATDSTSTLLALVIKTAQIHFDTYVNDPWIDFFGVDYVSIEDTTWDYNNIKKFNIVDMGYVFEVTGSGSYEGYDGTYTGAITIQVITNLDYDIKKVMIVESIYGHTLGFAKKNQDYLDGFTNVNLLELSSYLSETDDLKTGATGSKELLESLMKALILEVNTRG